MKGVITWFCIVLILTCQISSAQNFMNDLQKLNNCFVENNYMSFEVSMWNYENNKVTKGTFVSKGFMYKSKSNYYSGFDEDEMIINSNGTLIVNKRDKEVILFSGKKKFDHSAFTLNAEQLTKSTDSIIFRGVVNNIKQYTIYTSKDLVRQTEIYFSKSGFLSKVIYYYTSSNKNYSHDLYKTEIIYSNLKLSKPSESNFLFDKYLIKSGGKWKLRPDLNKWIFNIQDI